MYWSQIDPSGERALLLKQTLLTRFPAAEELGKICDVDHAIAVEVGWAHMHAIEEQHPHYTSIYTTVGISGRSHCQVTHAVAVKISEQSRRDGT